MQYWKHRAIVEAQRPGSLLAQGLSSPMTRSSWGIQNETDPASQPWIHKPFLAELGSVDPVRVVPGNWIAQGQWHHAHEIIATKMINNAHTCA